MGNGPSIHAVVSASLWFSTIVLSDMVETNRKALNHWLPQDYHAANLGCIFNFAANLDPTGYHVVVYTFNMSLVPGYSFADIISALHCWIIYRMKCERMLK